VMASAVCLPCAPANDPDSTGNKGTREKPNRKGVSFNESIMMRSFDVNVGLRSSEQFEIDNIEILQPVLPVVKQKAPFYNHSDRIKHLDKRRELRRAIVKARMLRKEIELGLDILPELDEPELGYRRGILKNVTGDLVGLDTASASYHGAVRQFLVDSGCPLDLLSSDDLTEDEKRYISRVCKDITLHTANGLTKVR
jgi:hypothetical protein